MEVSVGGWTFSFLCIAFVDRSSVYSWVGKASVIVVWLTWIYIVQKNMILLIRQNIYAAMHCCTLRIWSRNADEIILWLQDGEGPRQPRQMTTIMLKCFVVSEELFHLHFLGLIKHVYDEGMPYVVGTIHAAGIVLPACVRARTVSRAQAIFISRTLYGFVPFIWRAVLFMHHNRSLFHGRVF